jgi:hypothetical protein
MKKTQQNPKKVNKEKSFDSPKCNMISFGKLNLTFIIEFNPRDLIEMKDGQKIEHSINDIKSVRDLEFIKDNRELINRIKLKSEDDSIEELIMLNKVSLGNRVIEFFPMQIPKFNNLQFFKSIFEEVTKKYGLVINKTSLDRKQGSTIKINLISGKNFNIFEYEEEEPDKESDMQLQEEHYHSTQTKIVHNKEVDEDEEESEAVKKGLIPKFSRKECILNKLNPSCEKYDLMYLNLCNLEKMEGELNEDDLIELMKFLKEKKKTKIFVNFYKPNKGEVVEPEVNDDYSELENNDNNKEKDQEEEEEKNDEKNSSDENKEKNKKFSNQKHLKQLYDLTDIFFFDEKQALKMFDKHLKSFSKKKTSNNLNKAKLYDYFISSIA